jgi:hypothetical protein
MTPLEARLAELAKAGQTITYGRLAAEFAIHIHDLTAELETLMELDHAAGLPLRAALCAGRLAAGLPARGFFEKAAALGYPGVEAEAAFVAEQRAQLFASAGFRA